MSRSHPPPPGIYVPAVLFFDDNEEFDIPAIKAHILRLAKGGVTGIVVQGSNGEAQHLSHEERKQAISLTRQTLDDNGFQNVVIIAGCGAQSARETKKLCSDAADAGAAFVLVLTPSVWPNTMTLEAILRFHREWANIHPIVLQIADASPIPYMVYNFPTVTAGQDLDSDIIIALAAHPNIVGTKLSCGNVGKLHRITSTVPATQFSTLAGVSEILLQGLLSGSSGAIAALPNIVPKLHMKLYTLYKEGKIDEAMAIQAQLGQGDFATGKVGSIGGIKALVSKHFGYGGVKVRSPLLEATSTQLSGPHFAKLEELIALEKAL
ncbi:aldolase [Coniophora puteana RWD-64-598 SS2]|uniref:Aldolase n=1 Tax=Coniophora puteana (strain RWD-64-598) TaxID=741705 RepID=A0A5M3MZ67_CONPW|nr:aldolase [Coniophora puteana RWD-64-598 SS2]EIW84094.1 aldolase [Coniophora puteana RWD-64-598 SS2]